MKRRTETLDAAFKKRFFALSSADAHEEGSLGFGAREKRLTLKKGTIRALEQRRDSLFGTIDKKAGVFFLVSICRTTPITPHRRTKT